MRRVVKKGAAFIEANLAGSSDDVANHLTILDDSTPHRHIGLTVNIIVDR